jgi:hypothetical protein
MHEHLLFSFSNHFGSVPQISLAQYSVYTVVVGGWWLGGGVCGTVHGVHS